MEYIVVKRDLSVKKTDGITEEEVLPALRHEFILAFFRFNNGVLEYASDNPENDEIIWLEPE